MGKERLSTVQFKQKVIHLKSEVAKYRQRLSDYEENYHYQLLAELKKTNQSLKEKNVLLEQSFQNIHQEKIDLEAKLQEVEEQISSINKERNQLAEDLEKSRGKMQQLTNETTVIKFENNSEESGQQKDSTLKTDSPDWFTRNIQKQASDRKGQTDRD